MPKTSLRLVPSLLSALGALALAAPPAEAAEGIAPFGSSGQNVIGAAFQASFTRQTTTAPNGAESRLDLLLIAPSFDHFVGDRLSLGGQVSYQQASSPGGATSSSLAVTPRIGFDLHISGGLSFWPQLGLSFSTSWRSGNDDGNRAFSVLVYAPLLIHPAQHFFFGIGPVFTQDLWAQQTRAGMTGDAPTVQTLGVQTTIGGWF